MKVTIRNAKPEDAQEVIPLIIDAIGDIAQRLTGETKPSKVEEALCTLFKRTDNRHAHLYTYIAEVDEKIIGTMVAYTGKEVIQLDENLNTWLAQKGNNAEKAETESLLDEFYIDTICINSKYRGQGIGSQFFTFAEQLAKEHNFSKVSLNVEIQKEKAIRLYKRLGYEIVSPWTIIGEPFHHMVKNIQ